VSMLRIGIPDQLVDHATPQQSKEALGLTPAQMAERILERFRQGAGELPATARSKGCKPDLSDWCRF